MNVRFTLPKVLCVFPVQFVRFARPGLLALLALLGPACLPAASSAWAAGATPAVRVAVSIPPQKYFVQRIAGDLAEVTVLVPPDAEPHTYEPKPGQMRELAGATLYMTIGVPFERAWLDRITAAGGKGMTLVHLEKGIALLPQDERPPGGEHDHAGESADGRRHGRQGDDPHIWLSPALVKMMAGVIKAALVKADPAHAAQYRANHDAFVREIDELDLHIHGLFENVPAGSRRFMVFHPAWSYFGHNYDLREVAIEAEGREPGPQQLARIVEFARKERIRAIFVQPQFSRRSAEAVARNVGATLIEADPLAGDWAANLRHVAESMANILKSQP